MSGSTTPPNSSDPDTSPSPGPSGPSDPSEPTSPAEPAAPTGPTGSNQETEASDAPDPGGKGTDADQDPSTDPDWHPGTGTGGQDS